MALYNADIIISPLAASLPSPAFDGSLAYAQDTDLLYQFDGTNWVALGGGGEESVFVGAITWEGLSTASDQGVGDSGAGVNSFTYLTADNECHDTDDFHSTSTNPNRMTIPSTETGAYLITASVYMGLPNSSFLNSRFRLTIKRFDSGGTLVENIAYHDFDRDTATTLQYGGSVCGFSRNTSDGDYFAIGISIDTDSTTMMVNLVNFSIFKIGTWT